MPVYKVKILNKEINLNYEDVHKERLIEAINQIKNKIKSIDNLNGKISDTQLLTFLSIKLQDEIFELEQKKIDLNFTNEFTDLKNKNLNLNNEIFQLKEKYKLLETENNSIQENLDQLIKQINIILSLIKSNYED